MKKSANLKIGDLVRVSENANVPVRYLGHQGVVMGLNKNRGSNPSMVHLSMSGRKNLLPVRKTEVRPY